MRTRGAQLRSVSLVVAMAAMLTAALAQGSSPATPDPAAPAGQGWTGLTDPTGVIAARGQLMHEMEHLMIPLDSFTAGDKYDVGMLRDNAAGVSRLLKVVPHLFPPTTNLYKDTDALPATLALPAIWDNFDVFDGLATEASRVADDASNTADANALKQKALDIRTACAACHSAFVRAYQAPVVSSKDKNFDFGNFK
ncbi:MAG: cytochrome c [Devosia sp.]|nr:cytochrome c [Devosia sp.]